MCRIQIVALSIAVMVVVTVTTARAGDSTSANKLDTVDSVRKAIVGEWSGTQSGDKPFDEMRRYGTFTVVITESTVVRRWALPAGFIPGSIAMRGTNVFLSEEKDSSGKIWEIEKYSYVLRPDASPMQIDLAVVDSDGRKYVFKGIFVLRADRLTVCYDTPDSARPKDFPKTPGGTTLWTLQRVKK